MKEKNYQIMYSLEKENWWYKVRRKIINDLVRSYADKKTIRILDIGCGTGLMMKELEKHGEVYGLDVSEVAVEYCKRRNLNNISLGSVENIPFDDNYFDVVIAMDILEHVENDEGAILEIQRVCKKKGVAIIFVPAFMFLWGITDTSSKHFRRYRKTELLEKIENKNFEILRTTYFNFLLFLPILLVRVIVRKLNIDVKIESEFKISKLNYFYYLVFLFESVLLKYLNYPFGVSLLTIIRKRSDN